MSLDSALEPAEPAAPVTVLLEPAQRASYDDERATLLSLALPDEIISPSEYTAIAADRKRLREFIARVEPEFDGVCADAKKTWDRACRLRSLFLGGLHALNQRAGQLLSRYDTKQQQIQRDEERRLAEEDRQRQIQQRNEEAALLKKQGQPEMAAAVRAAPVHAPAVSIPKSTPKVEGLTYRDNWKGQPIGGDTTENRAAALALMVPVQFRQFLQFNDTAMNAFARSTKGTVKVPGWEFYNDRIPVQK